MHRAEQHVQDGRPEQAAHVRRKRDRERHGEEQDDQRGPLFFSVEENHDRTYGGRR